MSSLDRMASTMSGARLWLLAAWLGSALFFGATVAPTLFDVLRSSDVSDANHVAGTIVTRLLAVINIAGFAIALALLLTRLIFAREEKRAIFLAEVISLAVMATATGFSQWVISARMLALRAAMQVPIDQIARADPRRLAFNTLHQYSVATLALAMTAALIAFCSVYRGRPPAIEGPPGKRF